MLKRLLFSRRRIMEDFEKLLMKVYEDGVEIINKLTDEELENLFGDK